MRAMLDWLPRFSDCGIGNVDSIVYFLVLVVLWSRQTVKSMEPALATVTLAFLNVPS